MKYFLTTNLEELKLASNLVYQISRPATIPETQNDVGKYYFGWQKHPINNQWVAKIEDVKENFKDVYIHQHIIDSLASGNGVSEQLNLFFTDPIEAEEKKQVILNTTGRILILDLVPNSWIEKTHEELETDGWFDFPEI